MTDQRRPVKMICESCGREVREGEDTRGTFSPDGCDHWYITPAEFAEQERKRDEASAFAVGLEQAERSEDARARAAGIEL